MLLHMSRSSGSAPSSFSRLMPNETSPCHAGVVGAARPTLLSLSGARAIEVGRLEEQASLCRKAGHRYYLARYVSQDASEFEPNVLGTCLAANCAQTSAQEAVAAACELMGTDVEHILTYTAPPRGATALEERRDGHSERTGTEWVQLDLFRLLAMEPLPTSLATGANIAITFNEFRGNMDDYVLALSLVIIHLMQLVFGVVTFVIGGPADASLWLTKTVRVQMIQSLPHLCGTSAFEAVWPIPALGVEVMLHPSWSLLAPYQQPIIRFSKSVIRNALLVCEIPLKSHLRWVIPDDALSYALSLAMRGSCAMSVAGVLPELSDASIIFPSNTSTRWSEVERKAMQCTAQLEAAMWEVQMSAKDWPGLHHGFLRRSLFGGATRRGLSSSSGGGAVHEFGEPVLTAFICAPSRFSIEAGAHEGVQPSPECDDVGVAVEALPLVLAYQTGRYEALASSGPPISGALRHGERASGAVRDQLVEYHARATAQRRAMRSLWHDRLKESFNPPTAAVCIAGLMRSLSMPEVYVSLAENATGTTGLGATTSIFYVLETGGRSLSELDTAFQHLPPTAMALLDNESWGQPTPCEQYQRCGIACYAQFHKLRTCLRLVEAAEAAKGRQFDWLIRVRPDTQLAAPIGDLVDFDTNAVHLVLTRNGDPDDNFAIVPRQHAKLYFGMDDVCPTMEQGRLAGCAIPWEDSHIYPECVIKTWLNDAGVRYAPFPKIYTIRREAVCQPGDPRGCGQCTVGVCGAHKT